MSHLDTVYCNERGSDTDQLRLVDANKGSVWVSLQLTLTPCIKTNRDRMHRRASCLPQIATGNSQL